MLCIYSISLHLAEEGELLSWALFFLLKMMGKEQPKCVLVTARQTWKSKWEPEWTGGKKLDFYLAFNFIISW